MADTTQQKRQVREAIRILSKKFNVLFSERNILEKGDKILKFHGVSTDNKIALFVLNNELVDGKIKAGQRSAIFEKCYMLTLSNCEKKLLVLSHMTKSVDATLL